MDGSVEPDDDDDDDDAADGYDEPLFKYSRLSGYTDDIFRRDDASALAVSERFIVSWVRISTYTCPDTSFRR